MNTLLLASKSRSRRMSLDTAKIPYVLYEHEIDERACSWELPVEELVLLLARQKMQAVDYDVLGSSNRSDALFVLTADTLTQDDQGIIHGKPFSYDDACAMIAAFRNREARIATGFRLERRVWDGAAWCTDREHEEVVIGTCCFSIPEHAVADYIEQTSALSCAGGMEIEGYGMQFVRYVAGSYSAIMGMPLFELRTALEKMEFFKK